MTEIKKWTVSEPYVELNCSLGEAPFYEEATNQLRFVDIVKKKLHVVDLSKGPSSLFTLDLQDSVSITADMEHSEDHKIIVGAKYGYATLDRKTGELRYMKKLWDDPKKEEKMRLNDGAVDTSGRFWAGAMNDPTVTFPKDEGVVFRLDSDLKLHHMIEKVTIPNSIGWSADDKVMFFTDTSTKTISKFDYDAATGSISNRRAFFRLEEEQEDAAPDGFAIDIEGCLWTAVYGAGKVLRISPEGMVIGEILLPTRCITCPRFVGQDLIITSAVEEDPETYPESRRYGGSVFRVSVGVSGMPINKWRS